MASLAQTIRVSGVGSRGKIIGFVKLKKPGAGVPLAGLNARNQIVITQTMIDNDPGHLNEGDLGRVVNYRISAKGAVGNRVNDRVADNAGDTNRAIRNYKFSNSSGLPIGSAGNYSRSPKPSSDKLLSASRGQVI